MITILIAASLLQQSPLDGDPKLDAKVTIECPAETVETILTKLSEKTGEHIFAAPILRNDVLVLYAKENAHQALPRPSRQTVLVDLGAHIRRTPPVPNPKAAAR